MRVDSSNARAQAAAAKPPRTERKPDRKAEAAQPKPEPKPEAQPGPRAAKPARIDIRA